MKRNIIGSLLAGICADINFILYAHSIYCVLYSNVFEEVGALMQLGIGDYLASHLQWERYVWVLIVYCLVILILFFTYRLITYGFDDLTNRISISIVISVASFVYISITYTNISFTSFTNYCLIIALTLVTPAIAKLVYECATYEQPVSVKVSNINKHKLHLI
jgi:hypothetical protein